MFKIRIFLECDWWIGGNAALAGPPSPASQPTSFLHGQIAALTHPASFFKIPHPSTANPVVQLYIFSQHLDIQMIDRITNLISGRIITMAKTQYFAFFSSWFFPVYTVTINLLIFHSPDTNSSSISTVEFAYYVYFLFTMTAWDYYLQDYQAEFVAGDVVNYSRSRKKVVVSTEILLCVNAKLFTIDVQHLPKIVKGIDLVHFFVFPPSANARKS